ncbi:MAG: Gfo/Idh/MocA family oxidoreductase [Kiritimatiellae bacterium]|nr:Gfo/Idh/MocA family oxidoreductase [Kiritimatiellia bacterium]
MRNIAKTVSAIAAAAVQFAASGGDIKVGIVGLDTSHSLRFTEIMNVSKPDFARGFRVTAAYKWGSKDIFSSTNRFPKYIEEIGKMGVEVVPTLDELLAKVDCVCLETNDGREHLWQAEKIFKSGKRCFIDKPLAADLHDCAAIVRAGERSGASYFTASCLRFGKVAKKARAGELGAPVRGAFTSTPVSYEKTHSDFYWYAVHGAEHLYAIMGAGCGTVTTTSSPDGDILAGRWKDGRLGVVRTLTVTKPGAGYGGKIYLERMDAPGKGEPSVVDAGTIEGYMPLVEEILKFFRTGVAPVTPRESLEVMTFLEAAKLSRDRGGVPVSLAETLEAAQ